MKKVIILLVVFGFTLSGCQLVADFLKTKPGENEPIYGTFTRPGEDPGYITFSNAQTIYSGLTIQGTLLASGMDPAFDDNGGGNIIYGSAYKPGIFDVNEWKISADANYIYVYIAMRGKQYISPEIAANNGGWVFTLVSIFFGKTNASPTVTNVGFHSPEDGSGTSGGATGSLSARLYTTNVQLYYGAAVIGNTAPNSGGVWIVSNFWTTSTANRLATITTNDIFRVPVGFIGGSTTIAFRIPRVGDLANNNEKWLVFIGIQGWEDYGLSTPCPSYNGHLRDLGPYGSQYNFRGVGTTDVSKFVDLVIADPSKQSNVCYSKIIDASDMIEITLP
ncbi:MAG: glucodextranase DOMON-like domain-containing protein [Brevinematia bacterium]